MFVLMQQSQWRHSVESLWRCRRVTFFGWNVAFEGTYQIQLDSASVKVNGMMGIVAPCIVGFSMRLGDSMKVGLGLPWYIRMIPYDRTCARLTVDTISMAKNWKTQGFAHWWSRCLAGPFVNSITRSLRLLEPKKKLRFSTYALLGGEMTVEIVFPSLIAFLSKRLYCTAGLLCQLESHRWIS